MELEAILDADGNTTIYVNAHMKAKSDEIYEPEYGNFADTAGSATVCIHIVNRKVLGRSRAGF